MYTNQDFKVSPERFRDWFAKLTIRENGNNTYITAPILTFEGNYQGQELIPTNAPNRYFEVYIMDALLYKLMSVVKTKKITWSYNGHYPNSSYLVSSEEWGYEYRKQVS